MLVGTKAQFIKTAPILRELDARGMPYRLVYTGQHNETFDLLEAAFGTRPPDEVLVPDFEASTQRSFLQWCLRYWWAVAKRLRSGAWRGTRMGLVHGDTASTLFGAMTVRLIGARVGHVEAGLRSPRLVTPFPEEIVRRLVSRLSAVHYVPSTQARDNLRNVRGAVVHTFGNTLRDALQMALARMQPLPEDGGAGEYALVSIHRSETLASRADFDLLMEEVLHAADRMSVKFVLHPTTRERLQSSGWLPRLEVHPRLELLKRVDYPEFVQMLIGSCCLLTDGGSNQEEAAMLGLPTLLLRRTTERMDGLGENVLLSGLQKDVIRGFVRDSVGIRWHLKLVEGDSPTRTLVDSLHGELHARG